MHLSYRQNDGPAPVTRYFKKRDSVFFLSLPVPIPDRLYGGLDSQRQTAAFFTDIQVDGGGGAEEEEGEEAFYKAYQDHIVPTIC